MSLLRTQAIGLKWIRFFHVKWELLLLVFGLNLREIGVRGGMGVTRVLVKKYISKETIKQFQEIMLKNFRIKVTQKAVITKTLPNIGGFIVGIWNYIAVGRV